MSPTQKIDDRGIEFGSDLLRPAPDLPEIARGQEIYEEWLLRRWWWRLIWRALGRHAGTGKGADARGRALEMRFGKLEFLVDVLGVHDLVEVLHADVAGGARRVGRVVFPGRGVDAPARTVPFLVQVLLERETADEDDLVSAFAQGGDARRREPVVDVAGVVVAQDAGQLGVGGVSSTFSLDGHDDRFAGVGVEEGEDVVDQVAEVFIAR